MFFYPVFEYNGKKYQQREVPSSHVCNGCAFDATLPAIHQTKECLEFAWHPTLPNNGCFNNLQYKEVV